MSTAVIFGVIIIILLLAAAITFLLLWLNNKNNKNTEKKDLAIEGVKFTLQTDTSVTATWTNIGSSDDIVTLYASPDPINMGADGKPEGTNVSISNSVNGNAKSVTLSNLKKDTKYYLDLVVTNTKFTGMNPTPGIIFTSITVPTTSFLIEEIHTKGGISLDLKDTTKVTYDVGANKTDTNDLWSYDTTKFTISTRSLGVNSNAPSPTLYNNNGILAAKPAEANPSANSQWEYKNNRWCIKGTEMCMDITKPVTTGGEIKIVSNGSTQWINLSVSGI